MDAEERFDKRYRRLLLIIRERPGISAAELAQQTGSLTEEVRSELISVLIDDGKIKAEKETTKARGRPKTRYWPISSVTHQESFAGTQAGATTRKSAKSAAVPWTDAEVEAEALRLMDMLRAGKLQPQN